MLGRVVRPPEFERVLLVDDNDRYAAAITGDLLSRGAEVVRMRSAAAGVEAIRASGGFDCIVTDITMETQISGLRVLTAARRTGFRGALVTASTGLDTWPGFVFNRFVLGTLFGCHYLIPKRLIKRRRKVAWIQIGKPPARVRPAAPGIPPDQGSWKT
jgi:hypothetical protein